MAGSPAAADDERSARASSRSNQSGRGIGVSAYQAKIEWLRVPVLSAKESTSSFREWSRLR